MVRQYFGDQRNQMTASQLGSAEIEPSRLFSGRNKDRTQRAAEIEPTSQHKLSDFFNHDFVYLLLDL